GRGNESAPVGVGAKDGGLDQGAVGDGFGDLSRFDVGPQAFDLDHQQMRRPLGIGGNRPRQISANFPGGPLELSQPLSLQMGSSLSLAPLSPASGERGWG